MSGTTIELDRDLSSDHSPRGVSPAMHRIPRTSYVKTNPQYLERNSSDFEERNVSPFARSFLSNYSNGDPDHSIDPESSILVSKLPTTARQSKKVTITTKGHLNPNKSTLLTTHPGEGHYVVREDLVLSANQHLADLEAKLRRLKTNQLIGAYLDLATLNRRLEQQSELKEEMLRRSQRNADCKEKLLKEKDVLLRKLETDLHRIEEEDPVMESLTNSEDSSIVGSVKCKFSASGCTYRLPSMEYHEDKKCRFRPTRCPSLTCPVRPPFAKLMKHIQDEHDGTVKGRDRICRNNTNHLVSSYVNIDKEPVFYKNTRMTWVANELTLDGHYFYLECMRWPPEWHIWVYFIGTERDAEKYMTTIQLFREDEYGRMSESGYTVQRSYTGQVISIHRTKEEIAEFSLGFQVHDKQIRSLCGAINNHEEQLFGYEVTIYKKE